MAAPLARGDGAARNPASSLEEIEMGLLLEGVATQYGFDFRDYAQAPVRRGVVAAMGREGVATISALQDRVLHDRAAMDRLIASVGVHVTDFFREPHMFSVLQGDVFPLLRTYPSIRAWVAGCATGEEAYSLAVLLDEAGLLRKTRIFATDINRAALTSGAGGRYPHSRLVAAQAHYSASGGSDDLLKHAAVFGGHATFHPDVRTRITWAEHNLATDASFNEFELVLCANVMIYFDRELQRRVHRLLDVSLARGGFLALGSRESLATSPVAAHYRRLRPGAPVYQKAG